MKEESYASVYVSNRAHNGLLWLLFIRSCTKDLSCKELRGTIPLASTLTAGRVVATAFEGSFTSINRAVLVTSRDPRDRRDVVVASSGCHEAYRQAVYPTRRPRARKRLRPIDQR